MGAYSPARVLTPELERVVFARVARRDEPAVVDAGRLGVAVLDLLARGDGLGELARQAEGLDDALGDGREVAVDELERVVDLEGPRDREDGGVRSVMVLVKIPDPGELGPIEVWVNDAMASVFAPLWEIEPDEFRRVTDVTYHGVVYGTMAALRRMRPRGRGAIVQVGSALAYRGIPLQSAYCGSKHAIQGFNDSLRAELFHDKSGVHVTMVQMPALNTPQFEWCKTRMPLQPQPVPPIYQPEVAARAIVWVAHHRRREVWVGASTLKAIWANKLAPGLLDRYLAAKGYESQESSQPVGADRVDNFYDPVAGDHRAHGRFDARSSESSAALWLTTHRLFATAAAAAHAHPSACGMMTPCGSARCRCSRASCTTAGPSISPIPADRRSRSTRSCAKVTPTPARDRFW
jgi:short-subunit dehydrogenase